MDSENPELRSSLGEILAAVHLEGYLDKALEWCEENGAWELSELAPEEHFADFVEHCGFKKLQVKRLKQEFEKRFPSQVVGLEKTSSSSSYQDAPQPRPPYPAMPPMDQRMFWPGAPFTVKNTFIEPALSHPLPTMNVSRASTWANPGCAMRAQELGTAEEENDDYEDDEEDDDDADDTVDLGNSSSPSTSTRRPADLGEKTTTYDSFENTSNKWEDAFASHSASSSQVLDPSADPNAVMAPFHPMMMGMPMMMPGMMPGMMPMMDPNFFMQAQQQWDSSQMVVSEPKPKAPVLERVYNKESQSEFIRWTFDARRLKSTDREAVSPQFNVSCGGGIDCQFKMVLKPKAIDTGRGGACFKKSRGKGYIILRCTSEVEAAVKPTLTFRLCIKSNRREEGFRGPVINNFGEKAMCGLPEGQDEWDFNKVVDKETNSFVVVLELLKHDS